MKKIFIFILTFLSLSRVGFAGIRLLNGLKHEKTVKVGEIYEGKIELLNPGPGFCEVRFYQTDYLFFSNGQNIYGEPGKAPRSNAQWLTLSENRIIIPPTEKALVYYTIKVPKDQALIGTYWSLVMAEEIPEIQLRNKKKRIGVQTKMRYGIQLVTNIGDSGTRLIKFLDKQLIHQEDEKIFQIDIENIGQRQLNPSVWAELFNSDGLSVGRFESNRLIIYSGCSVRHKIDLTKVLPGKYKCLVVVDNGDEYVFGAQYDLGI